jgi:hypothetical protein
VAEDLVALPKNSRTCSNRPAASPFGRILTRRLLNCAPDPMHGAAARHLAADRGHPAGCRLSCRTPGHRR